MDKDKDILELIEGCIRNSRKHQESFYRNYFHKMYGFCFNQTKDPDISMTVVNDGFLKVFKNIDKYLHQGSIEAWMRRIMYNCMCDYFRKKENKQKFVEVKDTGFNPTIYEQLDYEDLMIIVDKLTPATKNVFILYAIEGYKHREIAEHLNISESTSKWHVTNAREHLKKIIIQQNNQLRIV